MKKNTNAKKCTICGKRYNDNIAFLGGYVCEECVNYISSTEV